MKKLTKHQAEITRLKRRGIVVGAIMKMSDVIKARGDNNVWIMSNKNTYVPLDVKQCRRQFHSDESVKVTFVLSATKIIHINLDLYA